MKSSDEWRTNRHRTRNRQIPNLDLNLLSRFKCPIRITIRIMITIRRRRRAILIHLIRASANHAHP